MAGVSYLHEAMMAKNYSDDGLVSKYDFIMTELRDPRCAIHVFN